MIFISHPKKIKNLDWVMEILWLWTFFAFVVLVHAQDQTDFISIDCGIANNSRYIDETTGINYVSDANFIDTGVSMEISSTYNTSSLEAQYYKVRSFPEGNRHCYTLKPARGKGDKYLIRASFMYGNYDGKDDVPEFDLYLGVNKWETLKLENASIVRTREIIHNPPKNYIYVCLVNTGAGTPFISALELRLLKNNTYSGVFDSLALFARVDAGLNAYRSIRFSDDVYDRIWKMPEESNFGDSKDIRTSLAIDALTSNDYQPPGIVMSSAVMMKNASAPLEFFWTPNDPVDEFYVFLHFAELEVLQANQSRQFNISANGKFVYGTVVPDYLYTSTIYSIKPVSGARIGYSLYMTENSTLPPILNAVEIYRVNDLPQLETDQQEVDAIMNIKSMYGVTRNWQGDPCAPKGYPWNGLNCSFDGFNPPHIISLNLTSSGLTGEISSDISIFTYLQELDLSNNNLSGQVPDFLTQLASLKILNLKGNNFSGSIPAQLIERADKGLLTLSVDGSTIVCTSCKKKNNATTAIVTSVVAVIFIILAGFSIFWLVKRNKKQQDGKMGAGMIDKDNYLELTNQQFTYSDVVRITNNFKTVLGEGGFGKVYHGYLDDNTQVAVKMLSKSSGQGYKEFQAEVKLFMKVHHRNLTALVGYCNEESNKALIYEYMANGNLGLHLSDKSKHILSWEDRMRITVDSAQGLEYLHKGCKPPIVHRDVKTTNILLNENFQAKMADFGLSRAFSGGETHVSTIVAGTPGYLDPEYYATNWLTEKSDVYSFGMVILVIITGRPVISSAYENISQWVSFMLKKGDITKIVDSRLRGDFNTNSVWKAVEIAMECVSDTSAGRPTMTRVVTELKECLTLEIAQRDNSYDADDSKYSNEMVTKTFDTEMTPFAR